MVASIMEKFMDDVIDAPNDEELSEIAKLAQDQRDWEKRVDSLEEELSAAKEALRQVQEFLLPEAMARVGMASFVLTDGSKIMIKDDVYASIRKDKISEAVSWLDTEGLGDIVKNKVDINFGRGENQFAADLLTYCKAHGYTANETLSVHPQTLKATVKEQLARGVEFPEEFFSVAPVRKATIKSK